MKNDECVRNVKIVFTPEELVAKAHDLGQALYDIDTIESEKKAAMDEFKSRISEAETRAGELANHCRNGYEYRDYTCRIVRDVEREMVEYYDVMTGDKVDERPFTDEDRQLRIDESGDII